MNLSLGVAVVLLVAKVVAAGLTGSSAIYSDAAESVTHVLAVAFAAWALRFAHKPSDETHHFGHDKVAFLSSGYEGAMISAAALLILSFARPAPASARRPSRDSSARSVSADITSSSVS